MAISQRGKRGRLWIEPGTRSGWLALAVFCLSLVLLVARVVLTPLFGLPLNYLIVLLTIAASGLIALYAVAFRRERSVGVIASLVIGLLACIWLLAETLGSQGT